MFSQRTTHRSLAQYKKRTTGTRTFTYTAALRPDQEQLPAFYGDRILTRSYQGSGSGEVPGRSEGFELGITGDLDQDYAVIYGYDTAGRLGTVTDPNGTFTYGYLANSLLRSSVSSAVHVSTWTYETHRNVIASLENKVGTATVSKFDYTVNSLGQRTARANTGTAFGTASTDNFTYNAKGEVTGSTNATLTARDQSFAYDDIGNRLTSTTTGGTTNYTANGLNQYTAIASSTPAYDPDGNQTSTGLGQAYIWDAENRLICVEPLIPGTGDKKVINTYDAQSRRVRRAVFTYTSGAWALTADEKFIYDGWNPIAVLDSSTLSASRLLTWGLDLSGSLQGAGGVGGLLSVQDGSSVYHYTYDANGNVSEVLNSSGAVVAHYEYDAFGATFVASGSYATTNEYRFSTKPLDATSDLYYYGFRYYNPSTGRWISRDPAGEFQGGANLYGFVGNQATQYYDYLGLAVGLVTDDFGRECCQSLIETVNYNYSSYTGIDSGHAQISMPSGTFGWGPTQGNPFTTQPGTLYDGGNLPNNISYSACPESLRALEESINNNSDGDYNFLNIGAPNCAGWACSIIASAGGEPPFTNGPFLPPGGYGDITDAILGGGNAILDGVANGGNAVEDFLFNPPPAIQISPYK